MKTKIYFFTLLMIVFAFEANAQLQKCLTVSDGKGGKVYFLTSQIDSINHYQSNTTGNNIQEIISNGIVHSFDISENVYMQLDDVDVSGVFVKKDSIGKWSEIRQTAEGAIFMQKNNSDNSSWKDIVMLFPNEDSGTYLYSIVVDENEVPRYITINECIISVDRYDKETIDLTIAYNDTISRSHKGLVWKFNSDSSTRAYYENNWQRNTTAVLDLGIGLVGVLIGSGVVAGSVISEAGTLGASTPISVPGIAVGTLTIAGGCSTFKNGVDKLFGPGETRSNIVETVALEIISRALQSEEFAKIIPDEYIDLMRKPNRTVPNWLFWASLFSNVFDNLYGKTVTWKDLKEFYYDKVLTGNSSNITKNSATLSGYIDPNVTRSPLDGKKFANEYGIILNPGQINSIVTKKVANGDGGAFAFLFENLQPYTKYSYIAYYYDRTNTIYTHGDTREFQTLPVVPRISNFQQTSSQYSKGKYYNDGRFYDYRFEVSTTVEIESLEGIADWGYVYKDPHGSTKRISLKGEGISYTDTRYAYYRNDPKSSVCLYGYVKYEGSNEYIYGDPHDYPLETYDLHVAKYEIAPNPKFENNSVLFKINVQLEGDQESLKECSEFGYYINCNNDIQYFKISQISSAFSQIGTDKEYSINEDLFNKIDYNSFVAEATGGKIGAYVVDRSGNHIQLEEEKLTGLIYDRKPSITFESISVVENRVLSDESAHSIISLSFIKDGTFWTTGVTSVASTSFGRHQEIKAGLSLTDEKQTLSNLDVLGDPYETITVNFNFELKNGQTKSSENSFWHTLGTNSAGIK